MNREQYAKAFARISLSCETPLVVGLYATWGVGKTPFLMLMGRKDAMGDPARVEASYKDYIEGPNTKLIWYEKDHKNMP